MGASVPGPLIRVRWSEGFESRCRRCHLFVQSAHSWPCGWLQVLYQSWSDVTASDGSSVYVCGRPHACVRWAVRCPWRDRYWSNQLGDHGAETSPTKWHSEPYGFEIIGRGRKQQKKLLFFSPYIDALWTVHRVGCESVTVSACLIDNMAKSIHLKHSETANNARSVSTGRNKKLKERKMTRRHRSTRLC